MHVNLTDAKNEAKALLFSRGNSLRLILLSILSMFAVLLPMLIYSYTSSLFYIFLGDNVWCYIYQSFQRY